MLLVSPHFRRVRTNELLLLMKWSKGDDCLYYLKSCISIFIFNPFFLIKEIFPFFPFTEYFCITVNKGVGAGINTLMSISDGLGRPFSVERWKRRVLWRKRWMERLFISRQSRHSYLWCYTFRQYFSLFVLCLGVQTIMFHAGKKYK